MSEPGELIHPSPYKLPWPGGMAEQCNRHRRKGGHCLSQAEFARRRWSVKRAGHPKGHATVNMVLGPFAETKGPRRTGAKLRSSLKKEERRAKR